MSKFLTLFTSFALLGLIVFSLISFGVDLQNKNGVATNILEDTILNSTYSGLESQLEDMNEQTQRQRELFESENPTVAFGSLILFSIVSSGKVFTSIVVGIFNILIFLPSTVFGVSPIISGIMGSILIVSIMVSLWILYKLGG